MLGCWPAPAVTECLDGIKFTKTTNSDASLNSIAERNATQASVRITRIGRNNIKFNDTKMMQLTLHIDEHSHTIQVPEEMLTEATDFFATMDRDMDKGWQMSREWVDNPNSLQRCQIAASKLLDAVNLENETVLMLMSAYILARMPQVKSVRIDTSGEMQETEFDS